VAPHNVVLDAAACESEIYAEKAAIAFFAWKRAAAIISKRFMILPPTQSIGSMSLKAVKNRAVVYENIGPGAILRDQAVANPAPR
jgi:hypothetical protein